MSKRYFSAACILAVVGVLGVALAGARLRESPRAADKPGSWGFDIANLDKTCKPCDDFYQFASIPDFKDRTRMIAVTAQGGLGLPERDYYFREDDRSKQLREDYVRHVAKMFELAGDPPDKAAAEAKTIMTLETALAKASRTNVERRDPEKNYNKMTLAQMKELTPGWSWENYLQGVGAPPAAEANVAQPEFVKELNHQLSATPLAH